MANNVEKFLIEFVLKDKDALQGIKNFTTAYQNLQKKVQSSANTTQRATRASAQALQMDRRRAEASKKLNAIYAKRIALEARVQKGVGAMKRSANFEAVAKADPRRASAIAGQLEAGIRKGDVQAINNAKAALRRYGQEARRTQRSLLSLRTAQSSVNDSTRNMIRSYVSLFTVLAGTSAINKTGQSFEAMNSAMLAAMGTKEKATAQIQFLERMTSKLGLSLIDTADQYTKFTFAASGKLPTEEVNFFFQSMAEAGKVLGLSNERMKLSFNAVQQMLNKTTVSSEELKRQLAESFPGAIQIFARAIGKSEAEMFKMMEQGQLLAAEIFPDVAKEMQKVANTAGALDEKLAGTRTAQGRFFRELETAMNSIYTGGFDEGAANVLNFVAEFLRDNEPTLKAFGKAFKLVFSIIKAALQVLLPVLDSVVFVMGNLFSVLDAAFGTGAGKTIVGIYLMVKAVRTLNAATTVLAAKLLGVLAIMDEVVSLFVKDRVGLIEFGIGKDLEFGKDMSLDSIKNNLGFAGGNFGLPDWMGLGKQSLRNGQMGRNNSTEVNQQIIVEVPAGANAEELKKMIGSTVRESTERALGQMGRRSYRSGD